MNIDIIAFGIARDIIGESETSLNLPGELTIAELKAFMSEKYPRFEKIKAFSIAINQEYQEDDYVVKSDDEIAIIPPVSGG